MAIERHRGHVIGRHSEEATRANNARAVSGEVIPPETPPVEPPQPSEHVVKAADRISRRALDSRNTYLNARDAALVAVLCLGLSFGMVKACSKDRPTTQPIHNYRDPGGDIQVPVLPPRAR